MTGVTLLHKSARLAAVASAIAWAAMTLVVAPTAMAQPGPVPGPAPGPGPVAAPASSCPDIEVIFARGTDDTPGLGTPGTAFVNALRPLVGGQTVSSYAVNYPASYDFLAAADGAVDAENRVATMSQTCPGTKLVL